VCTRVSYCKIFPVQVNNKYVFAVNLNSYHFSGVTACTEASEVSIFLSPPEFVNHGDYGLSLSNSSGSGKVATAMTLSAAA